VVELLPANGAKTIMLCTVKTRDAKSAKTMPAVKSNRSETGYQLIIADKTWTGRDELLD
jgi:hypothetical protein